MRPPRLFLTLVLIPGVLGAQPAKPKEEVRFEGQVKNGQPFDRDIEKGLVFSLEPQNYADGHQLGWDVVIHTKGSHYNFAACVTPGPGHGLNAAIQIYAWFFVDPQTGKLISTRPYTADFRFTISMADHRRACRNLRLKRDSGYASTELGQGSLKIVDMRGGMRDGWPVIDGFRFFAVLKFPSQPSRE